ncbi:CBS domain-containing protein [Chromohalobacter canadensis]|uniref:CBS domain-containing protein n=1 Tax=Chromohalobacter moromii TaxID=2860329 RepID=A0A9X2X388_9GAMM|nr:MULTISPECIES: CBS domain-containing protein [Chromohalobacter]MCT8469860.1 CBS domain-containing protein [Chromohalobacter canadensis]MCT8472306.1 CBS domain-containing protein [Chromohalobacter canadensis]MCT8499582.1 CBS domain-containing protein [Chromohalobacter canadensis]MCT8505895.1 CBS domain-containing protein [Chromohalobacter moromii]
MTTSPTPRLYSTLTLSELDGVTGIAQPRATQHKLTLDSPAARLLTDFSTQRAQTILTSNTISQALNTMKQAGVRLLMVMGSDGRFTGVINARELVGGRKITIAMQNHDVPREEVTVDMIQTPRAQLHSLSLAQLETARVGDLVETLKASGDQHLLITAPGEEGPIIRGLVSASDISRSLGIDLDHPPEARSFAAICQVILGHDL